MAVQTAVYTPSMKARAATLLETAQTWTWGRRKKDGVQFVLFRGSKPRQAHYASLLGCTCPSYEYRGACSHHLAVTQHVERVQEEATKPAPVPLMTYREIFPGCIAGCGELVERRNEKCYRCLSDETRRLTRAG